MSENKLSADREVCSCHECVSLRKDKEIERLQKNLNTVRGNAKRWENLALQLKRKFAEPDLRNEVERLRKEIKFLKQLAYAHVDPTGESPEVQEYMVKLVEEECNE